MPERYALHSAMSLFTGQGERKYLNAAERRRFYKALPIIEDPGERSFCETLYWTGCRPSEALGLEMMRVHVEDAALVFRTLKKHGNAKGKHYRIVPVPKSYIIRLNRIHGILKAQMRKGENLLRRLWPFGRQKGWRLIKAVMEAARIYGVRACARGLRHSFGVHAILSSVPETKLQSWMGHASLRMTAVYVNIVGAEDRAIAARMWKREAYAAYPKR